MKRFAALFMLLALFSCSLAALCQNDNFGTSEYKAFKEKLALEAKGETGDLMPLEFSGNIFLGKGANDFGPSPDPVWANHFGGTASDMANAVVTDNSGNIYITGTFSGKVTVNATEYNSVGTNDAFVAKLSNTGTIIWFTQISTTAGNTVSGNDIVIDATGNLYVTGHYTGVLTLGATQLPDINGFQFFYAKLNTSGSIVNGAYHSEDENERGIFIDVDNSGNVYATVTKSLSTDSRHESWILKYDSNANLLWAKSFDESFNSIIVYGENLFFSGVMNNYNDGYIDESLTLAMPISYNDIFIAKSDLNGNFIWGYVANHSTYGDSYQGYIDSDGNGNFYLTGFNRGSIDFSEHSLSDDGDFVGKFDVDGTFSWLYKISTSGTSKISVDGTGNCYVAKNLEVFMLNSMAEWQWSAPITKYAREIEVSSSGKIVEVGTINGLAYTSQFDNAGVEEWTAQFNGNSGTGRVEGLVTDNAGNIYTYGITSAPANFFGQEIGVGTFICKQDANGNVVWLNHFPEVTVTTPSFGNPIILDKQNQNVYICGYFEESLVVNGTTTLTAATEGSTFVIKYDLNGNYINHLQEDIVGGGSLSVVTDYSGNLILCDTYSGTVNVANTSLTSVGSSDGYLAKYDTNLSPLWALSAGGEDVEYNIIASTDADDNIYITGEFYSQNVSVGSYPHPMNDGEGNVFLAKINASGEVQWAKSLAAAGSNSSDYSCWPTGIVSNDLGETYIKGWHGKSTFFDEIEITSPYNYNYFITKLDADGNVLWANSINEATYGFDYNQFAVDASGSVYLGAQAKGALTFSDSYTYTPSSGYDLFVAKYRTDGVLDWVKTIQSMGSYYSWISSVAVYNNEIYVGGYFDGYLNIDGQELQTNTRHGFVAKLQNQIYDVTFNVDMTGATQFIPGTDNVYLSGTMYNWAEPASTKASQPLSQVGETMIWSITLPLIEGGYSYKYFINEGSEGIEWLDGPKREIEVVEEIPSDDVWASAYPELFAGGSGTEDNPFLISNAEQLNNVRQFLDAYYLQTAEIDLDVAPWNEGEGWEPIGNATIKFSGSYNGNYQIINNLYINRSSVNLQGLFGITSNAVIKNIKLLNVNVTGKNYIGAIAGQSNYSSIGNCLSTGTITGTTYVGGLVGFNQYGDINQCFSSSNVTGTNYIGGVTGVHQGDNLLLNSYSTGTLTGGDNVGGLVGTTAVNSLIENSYFAGSISGTSGLGGLVAYRFSVSAVKNSFWDTQTSGVTTTEVGGEGKTTTEMKNIFTYTSAGWDFKGLGAEGIWNIDPDGYPYLNWIYPENTSSQVPVFANVVADDVTNVSGTGATVNATITCIGNPEFTQHGVCWNTTGEPTTADSKTTLGTISELMFGSDITGLTPNTVYYVRAYAENTQGTAYSNELTFVTVVAPTGDGSPETPYQISSLAELYWLATTPSVWGMNFIQTNDIDASQTANWNNGQGFQPIGNIENPFMGIYNGNGFLISNVTISQPDNDYVGVFGKIQDAILYQVGVANANIVGSSYVGALAGGVSFSIVEQCFTSGSVEGKGGNDGGLFGVTEQGEVRSCYSTCSVTGYVGSPGQGGLIGLVNETSIRGCYSMGLVTSPYANGLIGNINGGEVENCYWDTETSGCLSSVAGTGKTTTEMKDISTFLNGGWDFKGLGTEGVWNIGNERNDGYPYLNWQYPEDPAISMEILPSAVIANVTNITQNSASFQIEVTNIGNPQGISFGVCWSSTNPEPTVEDFSRVSEENFALGSFIEDVFEFTHSTVYYARAFASSTNGTAYSDVVTFNTECGAHSLPLTENFDNSYEFPNCWNAFTVGDGSVLIYNFEPTSNPNHAWLFAQVVGAEAYLVLPELDADINTLNLQFMSKSGATGYGWPADMVLEIGTMTDPTNASTFSYFTHIQMQDIYEQQNISLATFGGTDRYIAFRVSSNIQEQAGYVFIDDINIASNVPTSLVTFNVDMTNASGFNPAEDVVYITGSMFGWAEPGTDTDNQTMARVDESMIWTKTIEVAQGNYEYKYFLNAGWENGEWPGDPNRQIGVNDNLTINDTWGRYGLQFTSPTSEDVFDICDGELNVSISSEGLGEVSGNIYFIDAMGSWYWVAAYYSNGNGITNYSYNIPLEISRGTCRLYLDSNVGGLYSDYFTVTNNSTIGFTQPLAAQTYQVGVDSEIPVQLMFNGCISSCGSLYFDRIDQWVGIGEVCFDTENTTYSTSYSIPGNIISGNYRFVYYGEGIEIYSEYFTITNPNVTLTFNSPNESDTYEVGVDSYIPVEFEHAGLGYLYFNLYIVDQNQTLHYVANYYAENDGVITHNHALTENYPTGEYTYRLDYSNYNDIYGSVFSNQFQIINNQAALSLVNPQTNGYFMPGNSMNISWNSNAISNVDIHYSLDNGFTWNLIEANVETQDGFLDGGYNSYQWQIPTSIEGAYYQSKIRVRNSADHGLNSESGLFVISSIDPITFIAPIAGTAIEPGDPLTITMDVLSESWVSLYLQGQSNSYGIDGLSATVGTNTITTDDTYMLSPGTYKVTSYHNLSGTEAYSDEFTVTCPTVTLPLVENFDRTINIPGCWFATGSNNYSVGVTNHNFCTTPNSARLYNEAYSYAILSTPEIPQGVSNLRIRFKTLLGDCYEIGMLYVGTMSDPTNGSTFNSIQSFEVTNRPGQEWHSFEVWLDEYTGSDAHIAFRLGDGTSENWSRAFIDNIIIDEIPACLEPNNLAAGAVTQTSAELSWSEPGTSTQWDIIYGHAGFDPQAEGTIVAGVTSNTYTLTDLSHSTSYEFYVRTYCGGNPSGWSLPDEFTTECGPVELSFLSPDENQTYDLSVSNQVPYTLDYKGCDYTCGYIYLLDVPETNNWYVNNHGFSNGSQTTNASFELPATLPSGTYRFRVDYSYNDVNYNSYSNEFEVVNNAAVIEVISPYANNYINSGETYDIYWNSVNVSLANLYYSTNNGSTWQEVAEDIVTVNGQNLFVWEVPADLVGTYRECMVKVTNADQSAEGLSPLFTISSLPEIKFNLPLAGAIYIAGVDNAINVEIEYNGTGYSEFELYFNGSFLGYLSIDDQGVVYYAYNLPADLLSGTYNFRIGWPYYIDGEAFTVVNNDYKFEFTAPLATSQIDLCDGTIDIKVLIEGYGETTGDIYLQANEGDRLWVSSYNSTSDGETTYTYNIPVNDLGAGNYYFVLETLNETIQSEIFTITDNTTAIFTQPLAAQTYQVGVDTEIPVELSLDGCTSRCVDLYFDNNGQLEHLGNVCLDNTTPIYTSSYSIPGSIISGNYRFVYYYNAIETYSEYFTITNPNVTLTFNSPTSADVYVVGVNSHIPVEIEYAGLGYMNFNLYMQDPGGIEYYMLGYNDENDGVFNYNHNLSSNWATGSYRYRVAYDNNNGIFGSIFSDQFLISNNQMTLSLTEPQNGYFMPGNTMSIRWNSNAISNVDIHYSLDNGFTWNLIEANVETQDGFLDGGYNSYQWQIPTSIEGTYDQSKVRVRNSADHGLTSQSGLFTISSADPITFIAPIAGTAIETGDPLTITMDVLSESWVSLYLQGQFNGYGINSISATVGTNTITTDDTYMLNPGTYRVKSYHNISGTEAYSDEFTVTCPTVTLPLTENFDRTTNMPGCWFTSGNNYSLYITGCEGRYFSQPYSAKFHHDFNGYAILATPEIPDGTNNLRVRFKALLGDCYENGMLYVGTMSDPTNGSTFNSIQSFEVTNRPGQEWHSFEVWIDEYTGSDAHIAFRLSDGITENSTTVFIDNIIIDEIPACLEPYNLAVGTVTQTSAEVSWTEPGTSTQWDIIYGHAGFDPQAEGTIVAGVTSNTYTLTDLSHSTSYEFYVRTYCGGNPSGWSLPDEFTTECGPIEVSFLSPQENQTFDLSVSSQIPYSFDYFGCEQFCPNIYLYDVTETNGWQVMWPCYSNSVSISDSYSAPATLPSGTYKFRMEYWYNDQTNYVYSDEFEVVNNNSLIDIWKPNSSSYWFQGYNYTICWNSVNVVSINISYSLDNGITWSLIESGVLSQDGSNSYSFIVPAEITGENTQCLIKMEDASNSSVVDYSEPFTISNIPPYSYIEPNALSHVETLGTMEIIIDNRFYSWMGFQITDVNYNYLWVEEGYYNEGQNKIIFNTENLIVGESYRVYSFHYGKEYGVYSEYFTVSKATPNITEWPVAGSITYGDALSASVLTGGFSSHNSTQVEGTFTFDTPTYEPNAGTYVANVTFTPTNSETYSTVSGTVEVTVEKAEPVISVWPVASPITYGEAVSQSTLSGGTVDVAGEFSFNSPATKPNAGTYAAEVTFTPSDNANYISVAGTVDVTVNQAPLTIIANSFSKKLGTEYVFVGDEFTTNPLELVGNDVVTSVTLTSAGAASAAIEGDYPVIPSSAVGSGLSNYSITYQNGTLSVVNRTILTIEGLTIAEKEYDGTRTAVVLSWGNLTGFEETFENVQLDITNAVILFDNKNAGNNKTVIVTGLALTGDDEWLYAINDQIVSGNILPKPLTIAAQNCSKTYGETDPDFTVSYNGFIAGENESVLEGTLSVSREPGEDVDSYAITPSGLSSNNYSITFDAGVFTIAPKELIVTATNAEKVYGSIDPVFAASYSGFEFGENQSVLTGELHLTREVGEDVDSYSITPSGLSASNYSISYVSGVLTITPKTLTITAENKTKVYGSDDPAFSIEYSGFVSGDDLTSLSGSLGYTREAGEDVGTYAVTPNGYSSINYNINYVDGLLGITKKALVVSADNVEKVYGSNDPEFSVTYTGFALDDDNAVLAGTLAFSREVGEDAGNYVITPSGLSSTNYSISFDNGELVIIPKDLTISAVNDTKVYGESDPQFAATYSGFITGEDETILSGNLEFNRAHGEDVGDYAVTPEGLTSNNYNLIFTSTGKLTVTPKPLTVTASNATKVYGSSDPAFSVTYSEFAFSENQSSLGGTLAFDRIAGETVGNYTITPSGLLSDNYSISFATGTLAITQKELTITAVNKSKVYGDADPVFTVTYTGFITGEDESVLSGTLAIDRVAGEDVGNYVITPSGLTATNYSVSFANGTLTVNEKELTVGGTFTVANREYDGLIAAAIATNSLTLTGALSSDNVTLNPVAAFADKNVGTSKIVSLTNTTTLAGTDAGNYTLTLTGAPTATANITPKALSVTGATVADKVYDGTTNATISGATLVGTVGNDVVTLGNATTGTFAQKSVGTDIAVTTAMTISGTDASNYTITQPSGLQADITTKELTVGGSFTVLDKVYDENTVATISENNLTLVTPVTGDVVSLTGIVAAFSDAEVGNDKIVTITAASLDGTDKGNYSLSLTGAPTATASITASSTTTFTVTFSVFNGNGTLTATVDGNAISSGDEVFASKDVVFTATPASGYQVKVWTTNGNPLADNTTNSLTVDNLMENITVTVEFEEIPPVVYTLTLEVSPENSGTVAGAGQYEENEQVSITATPAEGFIFQNWRLNGTVVSSEASVTYTMPAADVTLVAYFIEESVETYTLTLVANPVEGGLVIGGGEFAEGEVVTVTAQPSEGYQFVNWVITVPEALEGTEVSTEATTTFTMLAADVTLTANFEMEQPETYTVTFIVTNNQENSVEGATIAIDGIYDELITDASGMTTIELEDGEYGYSVTKEGFEAESGTFTVAGEDIAVDVELTTVGLNTDMLSNIEVFPNPFSSSITLNNVGKASRVVVTSLIGQKVMEVKLSGAERETIQTESLANGIYLIQIYNANGGRTVRKMMKE